MTEEILKKLRQERGEKEVEHGNKMIKVTLSFWTDDIAKEKKELVPKVCWDSGTIRILKNDGHGIESSEVKNFHSLSALTETIEEVFREQGIKVLKYKYLKELFRD